MTVRKIGDTAVPSPLRRISLLIVAILFFVSVTAFAVPPVMYDVTIYDGANTLVVTTSQRDAYEVLEKAGVTVNEAYGDSVVLNAFTGEDGSVIFIKRGVKVTLVNFDGATYTVHATGLVKDAVEKANLTLPEGTALNYGAGEPLTDGMVIEIYDVFNVKIVADGKTELATVSGKTVRQGLQSAGIELKGNDYSNPLATDELKENMVIEVFRVELTQRTETEVIEYGTDYEYVDNRYEDEQVLLKEGVNGSKAVVYEDFFINGEFMGASVVSESVIEEPVNELVEAGSKKRPSKPSYMTTLPVGTPISEMKNPSDLRFDHNGRPANYKSVKNAKATAYCIPGGTTSTGKRAQTGYIAVDPKEIPYGTEMYIVSADGKYVYGYCIAADTGGFIYDVDNTVDLYMNTEEQCVNWGRRDILIYFI